ncbi:MAG: hypothetical protein WDA00_04250 [Eubacteriales bacterium]
MSQFAGEEEPKGETVAGARCGSLLFALRQKRSITGTKGDFIPATGEVVEVPAGVPVQLLR